jgi:hypothetical protein
MSSGSFKPAMHGQQCTNKKDTVLRAMKFKGKMEELKGWIYDCADARQAGQFTRTIKEVAEYAAKKLKDWPSNMQLAIENLEYPTMITSTEPGTNAHETQLLLWQEEMKTHLLKRTMALNNNKTTMFSVIQGH